MPWQFRSGDSMEVRSRLVSNSVDVQRDAALAGVGLIRIFAFHIADELARGRLELVLEDHEPPPKPVHALFVGSRAATAKVRVFLDWAAAQIEAAPAVTHVRRRAARSARRAPAR